MPVKYLFEQGFLWRATGGCDQSHLADLAPNKGFETFRLVRVTTKKPWHAGRRLLGSAAVA